MAKIIDTAGIFTEKFKKVKLDVISHKPLEMGWTTLFAPST